VFTLIHKQRHSFSQIQICNNTVFFFSVRTMSLSLTMAFARCTFVARSTLLVSRAVLPSMVRPISSLNMSCNRKPFTVIEKTNHITSSRFSRAILPTSFVVSSNHPCNVLFQTRGMASKKHKRVIKMAKGYRGRANRTFRAAIRRVEKGLQYAYRDRRVKRRNFRKLWIERVNAGVRQHGLSYSRFVNAMSNAKNKSDNKKIILNRKILADLAANEPFSFKSVVDVVKMMSSRN